MEVPPGADVVGWKGGGAQPTTKFSCEMNAYVKAVQKLVALLHCLVHVNVMLVCLRLLARC